MILSLRGPPLTEGREWLVEVEARPIIVTPACGRLGKGKKAVFQHLLYDHCIGYATTPHPLADNISAQSQVRNPLAGR